jgi:hypothetical protein
MRSSVVLPAPLAPNNATASPRATSKLIPRRAAEVAFVKGWRNARHPLLVGRNHFSNDEIEIAEAGTLKLITCLVLENNPKQGILQ